MIEVVTAILSKDKKVLLLKRGNKVRTYKGKWAGVSGYLEENEEPLQRALKEIEEETGLGRDDIILIKEGEPIEFHDEEEGVEWKVYPFLFKTKKDEIKIDWEHTAYKWVSIDELKNYDTVPKLKEVVYAIMKS